MSENEWGTEWVRVEDGDVFRFVVPGGWLVSVLNRLTFVPAPRAREPAPERLYQLPGGRWIRLVEVRQIYSFGGTAPRVVVMMQDERAIIVPCGSDYDAAALRDAIAAAVNEGRR